MNPEMANIKMTIQKVFHNVSLITLVSLRVLTGRGGRVREAGSAWQCLVLRKDEDHCLSCDPA